MAKISLPAWIRALALSVSRELDLSRCHPLAPLFFLLGVRTRAGWSLLPPLFSSVQHLKLIVVRPGPALGHNHRETQLGHFHWPPHFGGQVSSFMTLSHSPAPMFSLCKLPSKQRCNHPAVSVPGNIDHGGVSSEEFVPYYKSKLQTESMNLKGGRRDWERKQKRRAYVGFSWCQLPWVVPESLLTLCPHFQKCPHMVDELCDHPT